MTGSRLLAVLLIVSALGCRVAPYRTENPVTVTHPSYDVVWDTTIQVTEKYFDVGYENRYDGRIETLPMAAGTLFEPWQPDTVDLAERFEATLQTIRRRAFLVVQPSADGGFSIVIEVYKELEFLGQPAFLSATSGRLIQSIEPIREVPVTSAVKPAAGWISLGRDPKLEAVMLGEIQRKLDRYSPGLR